jgi:hypothetical protein
MEVWIGLVGLVGLNAWLVWAVGQAAETSARRDWARASCGRRGKGVMRLER